MLRGFGQTTDWRQPAGSNCHQSFGFGDFATRHADRPRLQASITKRIGFGG